MIRALLAFVTIPAILEHLLDGNLVVSVGDHPKFLLQYVLISQGWEEVGTPKGLKYLAELLLAGDTSRCLQNLVDMSQFNCKTVQEASYLAAQALQNIYLPGCGYLHHKLISVRT